MNSKFLTIGIIAIIILSISAIYVSGEVMIKKANSGYSQVYFENTKNEDFQVVIENSEKKANDYRIKYLLNNNEVAQIQEAVLPGKKKIIAVPEEVLKATNKKTTGKLVVKVEWDGESEEIWKYLEK